MYSVFVAWVYGVTFLALLLYVGWLLWRLSQEDRR